MKVTLNRLLLLGQDVSLLVSVFAFSLMFIVFMPPISVGSLGVREAGYILLFGLFGVEKEVALAVSFVALAALVLTVCTGGVILLVDAFLSRRRI